MNIQAEVKWKVDPAKKLETLRKGLRNKAMRIALQKAASPIKQTVISLAPAKFGYLKKSIIIKVKDYSAPGHLVWVAVIGASNKYTRYKGKRTRGPQIGQRILHRPAKYLHLVDSGYRRFHGYRFMTRALNSQLETFQQSLLRAMEEQVAKLLA